MKTVQWFKWFSVVALVIASVGVAEESTDAVGEQEGSTVEAVAAPTASSSGFSGVIDIRPTVTGNAAGGDAKFGTENLVELDYAIDSNTAVGYRQEFNTQIKDAYTAPGLGDGIIRGMFNNLWNNDAGGTKFNYEFRSYLPTRVGKRDAGMITTIRNYLILAQDLGNGHAIRAMEVPMFHIYEYSTNPVTGKPNPAFQNRIVLEYTYKFGQFTAILPLWLDNVKQRTGEWANDLVFYPELDYAIDQNFTVGIAAFNNTGLFKDGWTKDLGLQLTLQASM